jgi:hypothetical protein
MSLTAQAIVAPPRHGAAMPRCRALSYPAMNIHYTSSNCCFWVKMPVFANGAANGREVAKNAIV